MSTPFGLRGKLLALLAAFGIVPLGSAIGVGYFVSRGIVTRQVSAALQTLTQSQAVHVATELERERLILRTIAGQLPDRPALSRSSPTDLGRLLVQGLPEGGVFDGLRIVTSEGRLLAAVALRNAEPHWPAQAPAADWRGAGAVVHREGDQVLAYLVAVRVSDSAESWLEGHIRHEDFRRSFSLPEHLIPGAEAAVLERAGAPVFGLRGRAAEELVALAPRLPRDSGSVRLAAPGGGVLASAVSIPGTDWMFAAALPVKIALAPLARLRNTAIVGAGILALMILATGMLAARSVTTPLRSLADAVRRFGKEGYHHPVSAPSADEVGTVVDAFNTMALDLDRSRAEVEVLHARDMERAQQLSTVGELASGVAHEIRNPLTGVRGALELALRDLPLDQKTRPLLEEAQEQLRRIESVTAQLLRYARPPALKEITTDVNLLVARAATIVGPRAGKAGVSLRTENAPAAVRVRADPELMVQVLVNLMLNGIEAMKEGGTVTVWVALHAPEAWIGVGDTGPGVPGDQRREVFRPFFTTKHQGTGLGLSISQQIVTRHGGTLRIEDTPGGGATFVVALPLAEAEGETS